MSLVSDLSASYLGGLITMANALGAIGGLLYVAAVSRKTVIPLRVGTIASAFFFLCSGIFAQSFTSIFLYSMLLPINSYRLHQTLELIKKVRAAASSDLAMDWLEPFMTKRKCKSGDVLFHRGDLADEMFLIVKGKYIVSELNIELQPGHIFGELGLLTSGSHRTQTVECVESGHLLTIRYDQVRALYFENPEFGFYFLRTIGERLLQNLNRVEEQLITERQNRIVTPYTSAVP